MDKYHIIALMAAILYRGGSPDAAAARAYELYDEVITQSPETKAWKPKWGTEEKKEAVKSAQEWLAGQGLTGREPQKTP